MKVALLGATGFVGSALLKEALDRGHVVTAIVRHPDKLEKREGLTAKAGDVYETASLATLIRGNEAIISAFNPGWQNPKLYDDQVRGTASIIAAIKKAGIKRVLWVGGAVALEVVDGSWWKHQMRIKSAGSRTTALSSNEEGIGAAAIRLRVVSASTFFRSSRFSLGGVSTPSKLPGSPKDARNHLENGWKTPTLTKINTLLRRVKPKMPHVRRILHPSCTFFENHFQFQLLRNS